MPRKSNQVRSRFKWRRGTVLATVVVSSTVMLGFAALAVDVGQLFSVQGELQRAADSAALAGASSYFTNAGLIQDEQLLNDIISGRTQHFSLLNSTYRAGGTVVELGDIVYGTHDFANPSAPLDTSGLNRFNAVRVAAGRTAGGANGAVGMFFAQVFGMVEGDVAAEATAAMDDRVAGYDYSDGKGPALLPFTIHIDTYNDLVVNGPDDWSHNGSVAESGDGVPEVKLFPYKLSGNANHSGNGNFGILEFGGGGLSQVVDNITNGIDPADMEAVMGTSSPVYFDDAGNSVTYNTPGEPGMKQGCENAVVSRIGDVVGFFLHDYVEENGNNAVYRNVAIRVGRIMNIDLSGSPNQKALIIQPVAYTGEPVIVGNAPSTNGQLGRLRLVK